MGNVSRSMEQRELAGWHREIMRRLVAVSLTDVKVNHPVVAGALEKVFKALNRPVLPIRWAKDGQDAQALIARAGVISEVDDVKVNPGTFRSGFIRKQDNWRNALDEALTAAQSGVLQFVIELICGGSEFEYRTKHGHASVWCTAGNALEFAARAAAECAWAHEYYETESRFRQYDISGFEKDWFPFVDAYEAGLWLFWLTGSEVIALSRPIVQLNGQQVHSEDGAAVRWPEGEEEYFVINGVRVTRVIIETPAGELDPRLILHERNAAVRREIVRKIGIERVCRGLNAQCVDRQGDYELLMLDLHDERARPFLKMKDPSRGIYHIEGVAPECETVASALAWRNDTHVPPAVLT
ncbi:MAG: hypothetical protein QOG23_4828 [Blastocatellia bacterium]|nr:hypothetical protein [Blastocatellia bacterium]